MEGRQEEAAALTRARLRLVWLTSVGLALLTTALAEAGPIDERSPLSWRLQELATHDLRSASDARQADAISLVNRGPNSLSRIDGAPVVEIRTAGGPGDSLAALRAAGADIVHVSESLRIVTAAVRERDLRAVAAVDAIESVEEVVEPETSGLAPVPAQPASGSIPNTINPCEPGFVISEGDAQLRADVARAQFDIDGTGVKVGVMSSSFDRRAVAATHAADDIAAGDLPGIGNRCGRTTPVEMVRESDCDPATCNDEGRAMAQIVHDLAPGAAIAYASASGGQSLMADNIRALAAAGSDVIVDDITYGTEPFYQDGPIAKAINDVNAQGVAFFTAAANDWGDGLRSYEAPTGYRSTACPAVVLADRAGGANSCMDFDPGAGIDDDFDATFSPDVGVALGWAEPQQGVTGDFDIYGLNAANEIVFVDKSNNLTNQTANEQASATLAAATPLRIVIRRYAGAGTPRIKFISTAGAMSATQAVTAPDVQGPTIFGHHGAESAVSVAAAPYNDSSRVENFSSRGPVTSVFAPVTGTSTAAAAFPAPRVLEKPDMTATNRGLTTFFGSANRFAGTSAAAPHAAAVSALLLSARPDLTPAQVEQAMSSTARPVGAFGIFDAGAGLVDAPAAVAVNPAPPPTVAIAPPTAAVGPRPALEFTLTGRGTTATCAIDGDATACGSPFTPVGRLKNGEHTFTVRGTDGYGQSAEASVAIQVDAKGPKKPKLGKTPKKQTSSNKARFTFKSKEKGATFECSLDKAKFRSCKSPKKVKVKKAKKHTFAVRAVDALGNEGAATTYRWRVVKK